MASDGKDFGDKGGGGKDWGAAKAGGFSGPVESKEGFFSKDFMKKAAVGAVAGATVVSVTRTSWTRRLGGAFIGMVLGIIFIPLSIWLLSWNEGRAVQTARSLTEGAGLVQSLPADRVDPAAEGRLVHVAGPIAVAGRVRDPDFGVEAPAGAVRLRRSVEMYQWREVSHSDSRVRTGGSQETTTTTTYERVWSSSAIDSRNFRVPDGHQNPPMRFAARSFTVGDATLGAFRLDERVLASVGAEEPLVAGALPGGAAPGGKGDPAGPQLVDGRIYVGGDPSAPQIGDTRISFTYARPQALSIVARQAGSGFVPFQTRAGDALLMVVAGVTPAAEMFQSAQDQNVFLTWMIRFGGSLLMFIGWAMILRPIAVAADVLPVLGTLVRAGTGLLGMALTAIVAPVTIAIAWFWVRPLLALIVLGGGAAVVAGIVHIARSRRPSPTAAPNA